MKTIFLDRVWMEAEALANGAPDPVKYPDSDGEPIAENTRQFDCIMMLKGELDHLFLHDPNVFVAGDLLWYYARGVPTLRIAPDAMVVFGRPKGHRGSYRQWLEGGVCPQVVFEVLSPGNRPGAMTVKYRLYESLGVEEYYIYDPDDFSLQGFVRENNAFRRIDPMDGWTSPRLGITFVHDGASKLRIRKPDGTFFREYLEVTAQAEAAEERTLEVEEELEEERRSGERKLRAERRKTEMEKLAAETARQEAEKEKLTAEKARQEAGKERLAAETARQALADLREKLRTLGINPDDVK